MLYYKFKNYEEFKGHVWNYQAWKRGMQQKEQDTAGIYQEQEITA